MYTHTYSLPSACPLQNKTGWHTRFHLLVPARVWVASHHVREPGVPIGPAPSRRMCCCAVPTDRPVRRRGGSDDALDGSPRFPPWRGGHVSNTVRGGSTGTEERSSGPRPVVGFVLSALSPCPPIYLERRERDGGRYSGITPRRRGPHGEEEEEEDHHLTSTP